MRTAIIRTTTTISWATTNRSGPRPSPWISRRLPHWTTFIWAPRRACGTHRIITRRAHRVAEIIISSSSILVSGRGGRGEAAGGCQAKTLDSKSTHRRTLQVVSYPWANIFIGQVWVCVWASHDTAQTINIWPFILCLWQIITTSAGLKGFVPPVNTC